MKTTASRKINEVWKALSKDCQPLVVFGLGFVGLNEAVSFASNGFRVIGYDIDDSKVADLNQGLAPAGTVNLDDLGAAREGGNLHFTSDPGEISGCRAAIICVPTPIDALGNPDLSMVRAATVEALRSLRAPCLLVLTSTVPPGTTRDVVVSTAEELGFRVGGDVFVVFAPERIDPNNRRFPFRKVPRVVAGMDDAAARLGCRLYRRVVLRVHPVSSPEVAEMSKIIENCSRLVNISLMNELAVLSHDRGIDIWEAIDAASSKPFGFLPHYPGAGAGGACIPVVPYYLLGADGNTGGPHGVLKASLKINAKMPDYVSDRVMEILAEEHGELGVLVLGVTYKPDVADVRESPGIRLIEALQQRNCQVDYHDPLVPKVKAGGRRLNSVPLTPEVLGSSLVVVVTPHSGIDYGSLIDLSRRVFDTRNALKTFESDKVVRL